MKNTTTNFIIGLFALSICGLLIYIGQQDLTSNEATLLSILLTIVSVIATWVASSFYSKSAHKEAIEDVRKEYQENLKTYALNAAEKVDNLSNELTRLSLYLKSELEKEDEDDDTILISKIERIESAIHIVNTLKSVNDTSLSDWKGVIKEELEEREEEKEQRENRLLELTERIEEIVHSRNKESSKSSSKELNEIKSQLNKISASIDAPISTPRKSRKSPKEQVIIDCKNCNKQLGYRQRSSVNSMKTIRCTNCETKYLARYDKVKGFYILDEEIFEEIADCSWCEQPLSFELSNLPFSKVVVECDNCNNSTKFSRNINLKLAKSKIGIKEKNKKIKLTEDVIKEIELALPPQPWEKGIHKIIATKLDYPSSKVHQAIGVLINREVFNPQINGVVYMKSNIVRTESTNGSPEDENKLADNNV